MRVSSICCSDFVPKTQFVKKQNNTPVIKEPPTPNQPQFRGKAGAVLGVILGGVVAVGLSFVIPVLVCAGPVLGIIGGITCDKAEEKIKEKIKSTNK